MENNKPKSLYERRIKRLLDVVLSFSALVVLSLLLLVVAVLVRRRLGSPVLFRQQRPGKDEKMFTLYKFRTMTDARDRDGNLLSDEVRLTSFGQFLRSTSIDELPELINILKGDMSIVGPRPLLIEYLSRYNEEQKHRHDVSPGLTGLAQVNGRNSISWEEKFALDLEYIRNISFIKDVQIVFKTVVKTFRRDGINSKAAATMPAFLGTSDSKSGNEA